MSEQQKAEKSITVACGAGADCQHPACVSCGVPMRYYAQLIKDHPGTRRMNRGRWQCYRCWLDLAVLLPEDLEDHGHILMPYEDLERIRDIDRAVYDWHIARRKRLERRRSGGGAAAGGVGVEGEGCG